jgi:hypothetical protein
MGAQVAELTSLWLMSKSDLNQKTGYNYGKRILSNQKNVVSLLGMLWSMR